uniref:Uncharacterized protein n=1 Tax=Solanum tuberosum TaxID=4113 RepID=M1DSE1_SOLTU
MGIGVLAGTTRHSQNHRRPMPGALAGVTCHNQNHKIPMEDALIGATHHSTVDRTRSLARCVLSPKGNDQVGRKGEQSVHRRDVPRGSTMSPNDPEHDDAEGWWKMEMNYMKGRITELIVDSD